eukprot:jgi/Picsp_1/588/NSC_00585-R1_conserved domain protein
MVALSVAVKTSSALRLGIRDRSIAAATMERAEEYPRPPRVEETRRRLQVFAKGSGECIVDTQRSREIESPGVSYRVLETFHPPAYYIPSMYCSEDRLKPSRARRTFCEWKGKATYFDVELDDGNLVQGKVWKYGDPTRAFSLIKESYAFYPSAFDCYVDGERVEPQPGDFYGGWKTKDVTGKIKGAPGTMFW